MIHPTDNVPIYLYAGFTDMRKGFDGLLGLVYQADLEACSLSGAWFVFRSRRGHMLKILYFDRDGLAIWSKRLERGRFQWPAIGAGQSSVLIDAGTLSLILAGIDLASVRRRQRWRKPTDKGELAPVTPS